MRTSRLLPQTGKAEESMEEYFGLGFCGNMQHKLWNLVENPNSSFAAKVRSECTHTHTVYQLELYTSIISRNPLIYCERIFSAKILSSTTVV